jgi:hypothetical protein
MWNSSVESPIKARSGSGGPLWVEPMTVVSPRSEAQAIKVVNDELEAPKANDFTEGENTT